MPRTGRPRKTAAQKIQNGTYRADRDTYKDTIGQNFDTVPDPPDRFNKEEKALWYKITSELFISDVLKTLDTIMLEILVSMINRLWTYENWIKDVTKEDLETFDKDKLEKHKFLKLEIKSLRREIRCYATDFGMSPQARRSLLIKPKDDKVDPVLALIG